MPADRPGHFRFDLPGYVAQRLTEAGVTVVSDLALCTYPPENGFFSFRRTTHRARPIMAGKLSAIMLTG